MGASEDDVDVLFSECNCERRSDGIIPQTVLALRGSDGVGREWLWFLCGSVRACRGAKLLQIAVNGDVTVKNKK